MTVKTMTEMLDPYLNELIREELSSATISKYGRDIRFFLLQNQEKQAIEKQDVITYKNQLLVRYKMSTVNSYLISINRYLSWLGHEELTAKTVRLQRGGGLENMIDYTEYRRLLQYCIGRGKRRDYLLLRTIAGTGIRVGELRYITYEAAAAGAAEIYNKGKCRIILLTGELSRMLLSYCAERGVTNGIIFGGRERGKALHPKSVWKLLKRIANETGVDPRKVYPHSLRHLFAKTYMQKIGNVMELADLLGHANIETTRIYAVTSWEEKRRSLSELGL